MLTFDKRTTDTIEDAERAIKRCLDTFGSQRLTKPEAMLLVFALTRVARMYLNGYPEKMRAMALDQVLVPFLRNEQPGGEEGRIITLH